MTPIEALNKLDETVFGNLEWKIALTSALEKQIPKKPILDIIFPSGVKWYLCPACNHNGILEELTEFMKGDNK